MRLNIAALLFFLQFLLFSVAKADGGGGGTGQFCRIELGEDLYALFSAYTPEVTSIQRYCTKIPHVGVTDITIDFESYELRDMKVGFKIIDEQNGKVFFEQEPQKIKGGILTTRVNFENAGHYDLLLTVLLPDGRTLEKHVSMEVKEEGQTVANTLFVLVIVLAVFYFIYLSSASFRQRVDRVIELVKRF